VLLLSGFAPAQAAFIFQDLVNGQSIVAGDKQFSDFVVDFVDAVGTGVSAPDYNQITVEALSDGGLDPGPGLQFIFNDQLSVAGVTEQGGDPLTEELEYIDLTWSFTVTSLDPSLLIKDNLLVLAAELSNPTLDTSVFVLETVFTADGATFLVDKEAQLSFLAPGPIVSDLTDQAAFQPLRSVRVTKNVFVSASVDGEVANAISVTQRFSQQVPVPASGLLLMLGMVGLAVTRRRLQA
jgi:hypothetical protein